MRALAAALLFVGALSAQGAIAAALLFVGALSAQEAKAPPALTEVQRLQLQYMSQQVELAQLRFTNLVLTLQVPGYTLDLGSLSYVPKPEKEKE